MPPPNSAWTFACRLTEKAYLRDLRVVIVNETLGRAKALDELLWTFNERSFMPHKICLDEQSVDPATPVHLVLESTATPAADLLVNLAHAPARADVASTRASPKSSTRTRSAGAWAASASRPTAICKLTLETHQIDETAEV